MMTPPRDTITRLLVQYGDGDRAALDQLIPHVYATLRHLARRALANEHDRRGTLNTTALVHEAYLKLVLIEQVSLVNRAHFFSIAARQMRHVLVEQARHKKAQKRGGGIRPVSLDDLVHPAEVPSEEHLLALHERLDQLERADPEAARVVEMRFFAGLTLDECAMALGSSEKPVRRRWERGKAWLAARLATDVR